MTFSRRDAPPTDRVKFGLAASSEIEAAENPGARKTKAGPGGVYSQMNRRKFLAGTAAFGAMAGWPAHSRAEQENMSGVVVSTSKLIAPAKGTIPVAVAVSEDATVIDFAGPWDVFVSVMMPERGPAMTDQMPFELFMVSDKLDPVTVEGGMKVVPHYTFENAPACKVAVIGAQRGSDKMLARLRLRPRHSETANGRESTQINNDFRLPIRVHPASIRGL